jgi:PTH1 family peptidyl-tRNA hydrolase
LQGLGILLKKSFKNSHNDSFLFIDWLAQKKNIIFKKETLFKFTKTIINNQDIILIKPQTYRNLSGIAVNQILKYFKINTQNWRFFLFIAKINN